MKLTTSLVNSLKFRNHVNPLLFVKFFGYRSENKTNIITKVFDDLINYKGVDDILIYNCLQNNKLDKLIHVKNTYHKSGYYHMFCKNEIEIGNLQKSESTIQKIDILNDNHCPNCSQKGFILEGNRITPYDSITSFPKIACKLCFDHFLH
jgi:hypothetical protein